MRDESAIRENGVLAMVERQRNVALADAARLFGEVMVLRERVQELTEKLKAARPPDVQD
jgi:hypothetical protein